MTLKLFLNICINVDFSAQSTIEVLKGSELVPSMEKNINFVEGNNMTITCRSYLKSLTLEYSNVVYKSTQNTSGIYTVSLTKVATKKDNGQWIKCGAVDAIGSQIQRTAILWISGEIYPIYSSSGI